jgi:hypothetical protein
MVAAAAMLASSSALPTHNWTTPPDPPNHNTSTFTFLNGNMLLELCRSGSPQCVGYVQGVMDGELAAVTGTSRTRAYCIPEGATATQAKDIAVAYLTAHPEYRQLPAGLLVTRALADPWPAC